ncbi:PAS domain-containing protein [Streptomyces syringium]|uniref:histidine kinase n=1 Tax=Streptomyces syringium TaxID=76729 RepID=A0ABS4Y5S2_9ACTN|nr:PAS domain-containing protein [Streptomyces syringium]MBP2404123.1 PAS domain S-box-containing protein [Streptomyces syringium]
MSSRPSRGAARLAAILDALPDALLLVNCNGTVVNANHIALETFEVPGTGLVGRGLLSLLPEFDSRRIPGSMRLPDTADARTKPTRMVAHRTDGTEFPVEVTSANLEDGRTPYADHASYTGDELLMIVVRDLTGTVDTEAELARQQRQTEMILRAAAEGVVGVDIAGKVVLVNPSAAQILGYRASDLGGQELHPLIQHSRADGTPFPYEESPISDTLRSGRKHRVRGQVLWAKDGRSVPVDLTTAPVRDGEQLVGAVMTFTDRRAYDALAARHAQLLAVLGDSLRGPLERLRGELGTLAADPAGQLWPEANQILHHLSAGYARMATLVDNVLAYQELDAGESKLVREKVALDTVVAAGVEGAIELIGPGRAQFAVHAPPIEAEVDAERFAQALAHLIADVAGVDATGGTTGAAGDSTIVVAAAQRGEVVRVEVRGPFPGGDPVHTPLVEGIVRRHGGVLQTHEVPGAAGGHAYVLEVPVAAEGGPVPESTERSTAGDTQNATTVMPLPAQRARGTAEAPAEEPAADRPSGRRARRDAGAPATDGRGQSRTDAFLAPAEKPGGPAEPQGGGEPAAPQPTGRRRARRSSEEEQPPVAADAEAQQAARANRHGRGGGSETADQGTDGAGLVPPQATASTGRRARREPAQAAQAPQAEGPRTAFALPPAEADRTPESDAPDGSGAAGAPTGRRARRALAEAPSRPIPGQTSAEPDAPRAAFALPPADADRKPVPEREAHADARRRTGNGPDAHTDPHAGPGGSPRAGAAPHPGVSRRPGTAAGAASSPGGPFTMGGAPGQADPADTGESAALRPGQGSPAPVGPVPFGLAGIAGVAPARPPGTTRGGVAGAPGDSRPPRRPGTTAPGGPPATGAAGLAAHPHGATPDASEAGAPSRPHAGPTAPQGTAGPSGPVPFGLGGIAPTQPPGPTPGTPGTPGAPTPPQRPSAAPGAGQSGARPHGAAPDASGAGTPSRPHTGPQGATGPDSPAPFALPGANSAHPHGSTPDTAGTGTPSRPHTGPQGAAGPERPAPFSLPGADSAPPQATAPDTARTATPPRPHADPATPQGTTGPDGPAPFGLGGIAPTHTPGTAPGAGPDSPAPFALPGANSAHPHGSTPDASGAGTSPRPHAGPQGAADPDGPAPFGRAGVAPPHTPGTTPGAGPDSPAPFALPGANPAHPRGTASDAAAPQGAARTEAADAAVPPQQPGANAPAGPPAFARPGTGAPAQSGPGQDVSGAPAPGAGAAAEPQAVADATPPTGRRRARRALAEEPGAAAQQAQQPHGADASRGFSVRTLGQGVPFGGTPAAGTPAGGSGRRRKLGNPAEGEREPAQGNAQAADAQGAPAPAARPRLRDASEGRAFAIGAPDEGAAEGPELLDGPNGAVEVTEAAPAGRPPMDDELPPEPLDNPRRLLVWPAPDDSTQAALTERGYRPVIVQSREEVDAQIAAYPAALFVDPLTGPITRTALQSLREAAVAAEVPVLVTAGLGQATAEAAYGADPAVLLKALTPRDSEMHPPRVLLIEEHEPIADALTATLERRGMQVARAATDADAVALAAQTHPNLVVMDLMQVRRRRAGIVDWLRGNGLLNRTPLVVYTSADTDPAQLSRLASGETVLFLAERSTSTEVQGRIVDLLAKIGTN